MTFRFKAASLLAAAVLIAGCGGSSNASSNNKPAKKKPTVSVTSTPATTSSTPTTSAGTTATTTPAATGVSFATSGNCLALATSGEKFSQAMAAAMSGGKYNLPAATAAYQALANSAPSAIRPDLQTIAQGFAAFVSAFDKSGFKLGSVPSATEIASLEAAEKSVDNAKFKAAGEAVEAWAKANCKA